MEKTERNGYINKTNKSIRDIGEWNFVFLVQLSNKNGENERDTKQQVFNIIC